MTSPGKAESESFDVIIIGAGMAAMAAALRCSMFGKRVVMLEQHNVPAGLNSYYYKNVHGNNVKFDVGLHALTNFCEKGQRRQPLTKLLKQLRIPYDEWQLEQQSYSSILYDLSSADCSNDIKLRELCFCNNPEMLYTQIQKSYPASLDGYKHLLDFLGDLDDTSLGELAKQCYQLPSQTNWQGSKHFYYDQTTTARQTLKWFIPDSLLQDQLLCPLLIYGSASEEDMDLRQFSLMFKALFLQGFARPKGGVRTIVRSLMSRLKDHGVTIKWKANVKSIEQVGKLGQQWEITLDDNRCFRSTKVLSSAGLVETYELCKNSSSHLYSDVKNLDIPNQIGKMSFTETIFLFARPISKDAFAQTITFYNRGEAYSYRRPDKLFDDQSAVICCPERYHNGHEDYGQLRVTFMANYHFWKDHIHDYQTHKLAVEKAAWQIIKKVCPHLGQDPIFSDTFTPLTIKKYTKHFQGTVYGSATKLRNAAMADGLYLIGTDQGFLGIVGAMLSGISIANQYVLLDDQGGR